MTGHRFIPTQEVYRPTRPDLMDGVVICGQCGQPVADVEAVVSGRAPYADSQGGHNDRHTLVVEAAERVVGASS